METGNSDNFGIVILFVVVVIIIGIIWEIFRTKCPACGKFFARKLIKNSSSVQTYHSDKKHTHKTTKSSCECKYCGHTWEQTYTSTNKRK